MSWAIEPVVKSCIRECRQCSGDHDVSVTIVWRSGHVVVDEEPDLSRYDPASGLNVGDLSFDDWSFSDGHMELEFGEGVPASAKNEIQAAFAADGEDGLEALGYSIMDTEYWFFGELSVTEDD
jgi:hypothetical protein